MCEYCKNCGFEKSTHYLKETIIKTAKIYGDTNTLKEMKKVCQNFEGVD